MAQWIEVSKQLPPEMTMVLIWSKRDKTMIGHLEDGRFKTYELDLEVPATHWSYLPEGPQ